MNDDLLAYYERELTFLRQIGADFAEKYPKIAARLVLEPDKCEDPHVERMIEAFAFLAGRVHRKLDDELPEVTESLLSVLYPHYLAPIPSMSIVQFVLESEQAKLQTGQTVPKGSILSSRPIDGTPCRFRTCYPMTIWPMGVSAAGFEAPARVGVRAEARHVLKLSLKTSGGVKISELREKVSETESRPFDRLRFHLQGEGHLVYPLYEALFNNVLLVELRQPGRAGETEPIRLDPDALRPVGFDREEGLLPYTDRSFIGYRLLQEYFTFPEKFHFFDLVGLERAARAGFADGLEVLIYLNREFDQERAVGETTFRLNCTPIVNLFSQTAEPIRLTHTQTEYRIVPDVRRQLATEVYSVDRVSGMVPDQERPVTFEPFYSYRHAIDREQQLTFWHCSRRRSQKRDDDGTEVFLTLVDLGFNPSLPVVPTINVHVTCTNRDLPSRLPFGNPDGDFELEGAGIFTAIRCLRKPTLTLRPALRRSLQWRLISHLTLNHLSLTDLDGRPEALQEILRLYDFADSSVTRRQIDGIRRIASRRVFRSVGSILQQSYVQGLEISVEFDEQQFVGTGSFLLAAVLERFFGLYTSVNSFTQLVATTRQREGVLKRWPPRAGEQLLL